MPLLDATLQHATPFLNEPARVRVGDLPFREIDVLGASRCGSGDFAGVVDLVSRRRDAAAGLVTHEFTLDQAPEAIASAIEHTVEVMKAVVRVRAPQRAG